MSANGERTFLRPSKRSKSKVLKLVEAIKQVSCDNVALVLKRYKNVNVSREAYKKN